jgi:hypothetical protein
MKKQTFSFITMLFLGTALFANSDGVYRMNFKKEQKPQIGFTENKGQVHDQNFNPRPDVLYASTTGGMTFHLKSTGVSYQLHRIDNYREVVDEITKEKTREIERQTIYRVDLNWLNFNKNFKTSKGEAFPGYNNYYLENCANGVFYVKSYRDVTVHQLYPGVDVHWYEKSGELKHDYIIAPFSNYKEIQIKVEGAEVSVHKDGYLVLTTPLGKIIEGAPIVFQNGKQLPSRWKILHNILSFEIEDYNPTLELIIDPVTRIWGTYYGGPGDEETRACTTDNLGNSYLTGNTILSTSTILATTGSHQVSPGGSFDALLVKFNKDGARQWGTYYGNSDTQKGTSCTTDASGNVYMAGFSSTATGTVIASPGSHQPTYGGGVNDAFLVKFNSNGIRLWGTFYGGTNTESGSSVAVDAGGNVFMFGTSTSSVGISTPGSHQTAYAGAYDAFLVKFNSNGARQWATYYGGTGQETGYSCAIDATGNVYIAGYTIQGTVGIANAGSHQSSYGGGSFDGFLAKFNTNGIRQWGTYYGGAGNDQSFACATDANGNIYMSGTSNSNSGTIIATTSAHQQINNGGTSDAFLVKFDANGVRQWGTYYGGSGEDLGFSCITDVNGNVFLAGYTDTNTGNSITTVTSHQNIYGGGIYDGFLAKFNSGGTRIWGTYFGGNGEDRAYSCVMDPNGSLYLAGYTDSNIGPVIATAGIHQAAYGGGASDLFLAKFDVCDQAPTQPASVTGNSTICASPTANNYSTGAVFGAVSYNWILPTGWAGTSNTNTLSATPGSSGLFTVIALNSCGSSPEKTFSVTVHPLPAITASTSNSVLCEGDNATLTAMGATNFTFTPGGAGSTVTVAPVVTSNYTVSGVDANGCKNTAVFTQSVDVCNSLKTRSEKDENDLQIFPNPSKDILWIALSEDSKIEIVNSLGQIVYINILSSGTHKINVEEFHSGLYIVVSYQASGVKRREIIIDK